jgi:ribose transport system permease protein
MISGAFFGVEAILTISYGSSMVAETGMLSMSRNFYPTMGCFLGMAMKKYGIPIQAIIIGEFFLQIIYYGFVALGAPTAVNDVISGLALLIIVTLTTESARVRSSNKKEDKHERSKTAGAASLQILRYYQGSAGCFF